MLVEESDKLGWVDSRLGVEPPSSQPSTDGPWTVSWSTRLCLRTQPLQQYPKNKTRTCTLPFAVAVTTSAS
ncbi:hypothetical protein PVAG01_04696 [Phlyctema vagabunda]|uniref:Uncharacterized protein n=1 Tax=Phlyctema vagabunda TaxID=108571 RepID=A0ABR4PI16_9HELO